MHYDADAQYPDCDTYATINESNHRPIHVLEAYCEGLSTALNLPPLRLRYWLEPSIRLSNEEKERISDVQEMTGRATRFWLVNAGIKDDYTCKIWHGYQDVVHRTRESITWVQIGCKKDLHPILQGPNVINFVGRTDLRQLVHLVYHCSGVLCGVTGLMHFAHWVERPSGTLRRPAVVVAGGRESPHWFAYPGHHVLHTIGEMDCCLDGGCWKSRVLPLAHIPEKNQSLCVHPVEGVPQCMRRISSESVADLVMRLAR